MAHSTNSGIFAGIGEVSVSGGTFTIINNNYTNQREGYLPTSHIQLSLQRIPSKPRVFHGRDGLVQEIAHLLCNETTGRVCILGPGGMGKTSLALAIAESPSVQSRYPSRCVWVPCVEATTPSLFLHLLHLRLRLGHKATDDILGDILSELGRSKEPLLLLLDNFETPWIPVQGKQEDVSNVLYQLGQLSHVAILLTMRGRDPPCDDIQWHVKNLRPVSKEASRLIFYDIYPQSKHDPDVDELLAAVGYMPYAVMLLAKLGKKGPLQSPARQLLDEWRRAGTGMISLTAPEDNMNRSISLSVERPFVQQNPDALLLLATLSLLPAGTSRENLQSWWAPSIKSLSSAIATLSDAALLLTNDDDGNLNISTTLFVLPVVQSFMAVNNLIPVHIRRDVQDACCRHVFVHIHQDDNLRMQYDGRALAAEDTNIRSIFLTPNPQHFLVPLDKVVQALLLFAEYCRQIQPSVDIAQRTLDLANALNQEPCRAEALHVLGITHFSVSKYELAEPYFASAYALLAQLRMNDRGKRLTSLAAKCGLYLARSRWICGASHQSTISALRSLHHTFGPILDDLGRANILKELANCLCCDDQISEALDILHETTNIFKRMGYLEGMAKSLDLMARAYWSSSRLTEALRLSLEACHACEREENPSLHARILFTHSLILLDLHHDEEAFVLLERCVKEYESFGNLLGTGRCLSMLGNIYMTRNDYDNASTTYEAAMEKYAQLGDSAQGRVGIELCREKLHRIKGMEEHKGADR